MWTRTIVTLCSILVLLGAGSGHPYFFTTRVSNSCTAHPEQGYAGHAAPKVDPSITFTVLDAAGQPTTQLCPGSNYTVQVSWSGERQALLTTTQGTLDNGRLDVRNPRRRNGTCVGRAVFPQGPGMNPDDFSGINATLTLPCRVTGGGKVLLRVTSAKGASAGYQTSNTTLALGNATSGCPAASPTNPACTFIDSLVVAQGNATSGGNTTAPLPAAGEDESSEGPEDSEESESSQSQLPGASTAGAGGGSAGGGTRHRSTRRALLRTSSSILA